MKNFSKTMMWGVVAIVVVTLLVLFSMLKSGSKADVSVENVEQERPAGLVGNDQDDHGCITSAGYTWSELLQECIRPFEKGVKLLGVDSDDAIYAAYLVFNEDSSQVEVFMPKEKQHPILKKDVIGVNEVVWVSSEKDMPVVKKLDGKFQLIMEEKALFLEE